MDSLWTPYGVPMEYLWNNTVATRLPPPSSALTPPGPLVAWAKRPGTDLPISLLRPKCRRPHRMAFQCASFQRYTGFGFPLLAPPDTVDPALQFQLDRKSVVQGTRVDL